MSANDAVAREVAWLTSTGDNLPALPASAGGPWSVIQAYKSRTPSTRLSGIYIPLPNYTWERWGNQRKLYRYSFTADIVWPVGSTSTGMAIWETEQEALGSAVDLLVDRIGGDLFDHTHGGRFLSVAEAPEPGRITVHFADPEQTANASPATLRATVTWSADDQVIA